MFDIHHTKEVVIRQPNNDLPPPREEFIPPVRVRQTLRPGTATWFFGLIGWPTPVITAD